MKKKHEFFNHGDIITLQILCRGEYLAFRSLMMDVENNESGKA